MRACDSRLMPEMQKQPVSVELSATTRALAEKYAETRANTIEHSRNRQALTVPPIRVPEAVHRLIDDDECIESTLRNHPKTRVRSSEAIRA